ncbi:MAG: hypothetical protein IPO83_05350 [Chitinophagaceae bacterium]|nr:hypothetical protein [Chitinophagaceae bacterium]
MEPVDNGGGGGGGGYAMGEYTVTPMSVLEATVGTGGNGSAEGTTSVDQLISASGGENGSSVPNPNLGGGGAAGVGAGGNISNRTVAVIVSNEFCTDTSECVNLIETGLTNVSNEDVLIVYPTNFTTNIHIEHATGHEKYELSNEAGQLIWTGKHIEQQNFQCWKPGGIF